MRQTACVLSFKNLNTLFRNLEEIDKAASVVTGFSAVSCNYKACSKRCIVKFPVYLLVLLAAVRRYLVRTVANA